MTARLDAHFKALDALGTTNDKTKPAGVAELANDPSGDDPSAKFDKHFESLACSRCSRRRSAAASATHAADNDNEAVLVRERGLRAGELRAFLCAYGGGLARQHGGIIAGVAPALQQVVVALPRANAARVWKSNRLCRRLDVGPSGGASSISLP